MFANFQSLGKNPWSIDLLYSLHRGSEIAESVLLANERRDCHTRRTYRTGQSVSRLFEAGLAITLLKLNPLFLVSAGTCVSTHPSFQKSKLLLMQTKFLKKYFQYLL